MTEETAIGKVMTVVTSGVSIHQVKMLANLICEAYDQGVHDANKHVI